MASGWNLWARLECVGVVSGCCCEEVYRFPHNITYPYSTCVSSLQQHPYFFVHFLNVLLFFHIMNLVLFSMYTYSDQTAVNDNSVICKPNIAFTPGLVL